MRIFLGHNRYQNRGGEDVVFETERALLEEADHDVVVYERHNDEIESYSPLKRLDLARKTIWANDSLASIRNIIRKAQPEIAHFYNTFPLISPSAYSAFASEGIPVIQTLPNFRLICPGAQLLRQGKPCEKCVAKKYPWPGVWHRCYRGSFAATAVVASMVSFHRMVGTWDRQVSRYIALTEFSRRKYIEGGLPSDRIVVKPNFINPDPGPGKDASDYVLFVGRLAEGKGIGTLLRAWEKLSGIPLLVAGDGPHAALVSKAIRRSGRNSIKHLGWQSRSEILGLMKNASFLVVPSEWYEGFPLTIVEAFACALPVIGSRLGGVGEVVRHEVSGLHFEPRDADQLASAVRRLWSDEELRRQLGAGARRQFEDRYTAAKNYEMMMEIFEGALP